MILIVDGDRTEPVSPEAILLALVGALPEQAAARVWAIALEVQAGLNKAKEAAGGAEVAPRATLRRVVLSGGSNV